MQVRNVRWVGSATTAYDEMVSFVRDVLGLRANFEEAASTEFTTVEGDRFQVMGPGDRYHAFFTANASGPVPLFEVDDVRQALTELQAAGVDVVGSLEQDSEWEWIHFRAPDGHLYELASRRDEHGKGAGDPAK
jgi:catechol 2,3-dioxygenase-like lactoylglutathione lyase family enzyme